jgi:hypothetical protein
MPQSRHASPVHFLRQISTRFWRTFSAGPQRRRQPNAPSFVVSVLVCNSTSSDTQAEKYPDTIKKNAAAGILACHSAISFFYWNLETKVKLNATMINIMKRIVTIYIYISTQSLL